MGLFKSREEKGMDAIIERMAMNLSNNYKDNAQENLKELEEAINALRESGKVKDKVLANYESILGVYKEKLKGYSHKDQKPYWH